MTDQADKEAAAAKVRERYQKKLSKSAKELELKRLKKKLIMKEYYQKNKEKIDKRNRLWEKNNPDKVRLLNQRQATKRAMRKQRVITKYLWAQPVRILST